MFVLWKDHTAVREAAEINRLAQTWGGTDFTKFEGGIYSSEWFWAKILHVLREDPAVRRAAYVLGGTLRLDYRLAHRMQVMLENRKRSRCAAGHKAMWHESFGGLPSEEFLVAARPAPGRPPRAALHPHLDERPSSAGLLSDAGRPGSWASCKGVVGVGAFDAHMGAVGGGIPPYMMTKIMGTSTCDVLIAPHGEMGGKLIRGICGQVDGSVIPGMLGMEAGQSAFGDIYAWFKSS